MADITKCTGDKCPIKTKCYRFLAPADNEWQSFFSELPYDFEKDDCDYFWHINQTTMFNES